MQAKNFIRARRMQRMLEKLAYYSLFIDFAITFVTLISINIHKNLSGVLFYLNLALSVVVVISIFIFILIFGISHYEKIINRIAAMKLRGQPRKGTKHY